MEVLLIATKRGINLHDGENVSFSSCLINIHFAFLSGFVIDRTGSQLLPRAK